MTHLCSTKFIQCDIPTELNTLEYRQTGMPLYHLFKETKALITGTVITLFMHLNISVIGVLLHTQQYDGCQLYVNVCGMVTI